MEAASLLAAMRYTDVAPLVDGFEELVASLGVELPITDGAAVPLFDAVG